MSFTTVIRPRQRPPATATTARPATAATRTGPRPTLHLKMSGPASDGTH